MGSALSKILEDGESVIPQLIHGIVQLRGQIELSKDREINNLGGVLHGNSLAVEETCDEGIRDLQQWLITLTESVNSLLIPLGHISLQASQIILRPLDLIILLV